MGKVLVIDDERSIRITMKEFLVRDGYEVRVAGDADEAMAKLKKEEFDVVVTDIILPKVSGVELLKAIRKSAPQVQVIMMTGEPTLETATESVRAGAFDYLSKPISKATILRTVGHASRIKILQDENRRYHEELEQLVEERTRQLLESEETYRALIKGLPDIVMRFDRDGRHLYVSGNVEQALGIPADRFVGKTHRELGFPEELCVFWEKSISTVFDSGEFHETEFWFENENEPVIYNWRLVPERNSRNDVGSVLTISRDITERKKAEQELEQYRNHLEELVDERTRELEVRTQELESFNKAMVDREMRIIELKEKVNQLCETLGLKPAYPPIWKEG